MNQRIWLVTGISSGLGKAMAEAIINSGDFVIGTFRDDDKIVEFNKRNIGKGKGVKLDITQISEIDSVVAQIISEFGRIDVLVNNAGVGFAGAIEEATIDEVRKVFEPNFFGTLKLTQAVLPYMRKNRDGDIIQISSHAGVKAFAGFGIYNASKFALEGFSEALAQEVEPLGIKVTIVEPGPFRTNFAGRSLCHAANEIEDYNSTAGTFRQKLKAAHNNQEGDPVKAAQIIIDHINSDHSTLRLPLGNIPLKTISMKIDSLSSDLETNRTVAAKAVYS